MRQFTNIPASNELLIYVLANQAQRNAANIAAKARIICNPDRITEIQDLLKSNTFKLLLEMALAGNQAAIEKVDREVLKYVAFPGAAVPFSDTQRKYSIITQMAYFNKFGLPSVFATISPDMSRNMWSIRLSHPSKSNVGFPANVTDEHWDALKHGSTIPDTQFSFSDSNLSKMSALNPTASVDIFFLLILNTLSELVGIPIESWTRKTYNTMEATGIYGRPYAFFGVIETQGRGTFHIHFFVFGEYYPNLLQLAARHELFRVALLKGMETMFCSNLDRATHLDYAILRAKLSENSIAGTTVIDIPISAQRTQPTIPIFDESTATFTEFNLTRLNQTATRLQMHTHSATCHKPPQGTIGCRMGMPQYFVPDSLDVGEGGEVTCYVPTFNGNYRKVDTFPEISPECGHQRDFNRNPIPLRDKTMLVWDGSRPMIHPLEASDEPKVSGLRQRTVDWINRILPVQNGRLVAFNPLLLVLMISNQAMYALSGLSQATNMVWYMSPYIAKGLGALASLASVIAMAFEKMKKYGSTAADAGDPQRQSILLFQRMLNGLNGKKELGIQEAVAILNGYPAELCSHKTVYVYVSDAIQYITELRKKRGLEMDLSGSDLPHDDVSPLDDYPEDDGNSDADYDMDAGGNNDDAPYVTGLKKNARSHNKGTHHDEIPDDRGDGNGTSIIGDITKRTGTGATVLRQIVNYLNRDLDAFGNYNLVEWVECTSVLEILDSMLDETGHFKKSNSESGRGSNFATQFSKDHPAYTTLYNQIRSKLLVPILKRNPPQFPQHISTDADRNRQREAELYYMVAFMPTTLDMLTSTDPSIAIDYSHAGFVKFITELEFGHGRNFDDRAPTMIDCYRLGQIINASRGLSVTKSETLILERLRKSGATKWDDKSRAMSDGCEPPPGILHENSGLGGEMASDMGIKIPEFEAQRRAMEAANAMKETLERELLANEINDAMEADARKKETEDKMANHAKTVSAAFNDVVMHADQNIGRLPNNFGAVGSDNILTSLLSEQIERSAKALKEDIQIVEQPIEDGQNLARMQVSSTPLDINDNEYAERMSMLPKPDLTGLSDDQKRVFLYFMEYFLHAACIQKDMTMDIKAPILLLCAEPGAGKTYVTVRLLKYADELGISYVCGAPSANAANNLPHGATLHSILSVGINKTSYNSKPLSSSALERMKEKHNGTNKLRFFVVDEVSMVDMAFLGLLNERLQSFMDTRDQLGNVGFLFLGDFYQIPPVGGKPMPTCLVNDSSRMSQRNKLSIAGVDIFRNITTFSIKTQQRGLGKQAVFVKEVRNSKRVTASLLSQLKVISKDDLIANPKWRFAYIAVISNKMALEFNYLQSLAYAKYYRLKMVVWLTPLDRENFGERELTVQERGVVFDNHLELRQWFVYGAPVTLTSNISAGATSKGVCNGTTGSFHSLKFSDEDRDRIQGIVSSSLSGEPILIDCVPESILIKLDRPSLKDGSYKFSTQENLADGEEKETTIVIPLTRTYSEHKKVRASEFITGTVNFKEFPYELGFSGTSHRLQGTTMDLMYIDLNHSPGTPYMTWEQWNILVSRVRNMEELRVLPMIDLALSLHKPSLLHINPDTVIWEQCLADTGKFDPSLVTAVSEKVHNEFAKFSKLQNKCVLKLCERDTVIPPTLADVQDALVLKSFSEGFSFDMVEKIMRDCFQPSSHEILSTYCDGILDCSLLLSIPDCMRSEVIDFFMQRIGAIFKQRSVCTIASKLADVIVQQADSAPTISNGYLTKLRDEDLRFYTRDEYVFVPVLHKDATILLWINNISRLTTVIDPLGIDHCKSPEVKSIVLKLNEFFKIQRGGIDHLVVPCSDDTFSIPVNTVNASAKYICAIVLWTVLYRRLPTKADFNSNNIKAMEAVIVLICTNPSLLRL